ncbi:putative uncharacterized protein DDB_G0268234 isoform X1 [Myripristis murdjan]|uniref:putative uncharacterized protein DDB_G0268234 isoform X1 n=1 Tax=Myripristis murdjan TaxID=586833 RepID=UPI001175C92E|nr:putative uncharacterized protein DDB_G0268234 isoform X1 [Myripristis murdjan]
MPSISTSAHPAVPSPEDISIAPTSTTETRHADTSSATTNSITPAAVNIPLTNPESANSNNVSTILTTPISALHTTDNSSATSDPVTSPLPSVYISPGQDNALPTSPEEKSSLEPAGKDTAADKEDAMAQKKEQNEMNDNRNDRDDNDDGVKEAEDEKEKAPLVKSAVAKTEVQEENTKVDDDTMRKEKQINSTESNKNGELSGNEGMKEGEKQEETKSVDEKKV